MNPEVQRKGPTRQNIVRHMASDQDNPCTPAGPARRSTSCSPSVRYTTEGTATAATAAAAAAVDAAASNTFRGVYVKD